MDASAYSFFMQGMTSSTWDNMQEFEWIEVTGGGLEAPIFIRTARTADDRFVVNGLILGGAWPRPEITAKSLRSIKLGGIVEQLWSDFSLTDPPDYGDLEDSLTWALMQDFARKQDWLPHASQSGQRAVGKPELEEFAKTYSEERLKNPRRAMTATAARMSISRATANRWASKCRTGGLLP
jgi:hypothetical protein